MKSGDAAWKAGRAAGIAAMLALSVAIVVSWAFYPGGYSPLTNWISDLGNQQYNPNGAVFMNAGFILTGIAFFPFCFGLRKWHSHGKRGSAIFASAVLAGFVAALSMVMIGVFPENYAASHEFWAVTLFGSLGFFLLLSALHLFACVPKNPTIRRITYFGFAAFVIDVTFGIAFYDHIFEWAAAFASFAYVALLSYAMYGK